MNYTPVVLCGCHGGGTSFIARLLRHAGLFLGSDAGPIEVRKHHESVSFREENIRILKLLGVDGSGKDPIKVKTLAASYGDGLMIKSVANQVHRDKVLGAFSGDVGLSAPWGWKDPRNSLTFPVWKQLFPGAKAVIISKSIENRPPRSYAGLWFREAPEWLRRYYMHPSWFVAGDYGLEISFEKVVSNAEEFNRLLEFCHLPLVSPAAYRELLNKANFEQNDSLVTKLLGRTISTSIAMKWLKLRRWNKIRHRKLSEKQKHKERAAAGGKSKRV